MCIRVQADVASAEGTAKESSRALTHKITQHSVQSREGLCSRLELFFSLSLFCELLPSTQSIMAFSEQVINTLLSLFVGWCSSKHPKEKAVNVFKGRKGAQEVAGGKRARHFDGSPDAKKQYSAAHPT